MSEMFLVIDAPRTGTNVLPKYPSWLTRFSVTLPCFDASNKGSVNAAYGPLCANAKNAEPSISVAALRSSGSFFVRFCLLLIS